MELVQYQRREKCSPKQGLSQSNKVLLPEYGYLLSEGERLGLDITAILAECSPMYPDARAAALAIEAVSELIEIEIPLSSLIEDARAIENSVQEIFENAQNALPAPEDTSLDPSFG